jgi:hypothetical protein
VERKCQSIYDFVTSFVTVMGNVVVLHTFIFNKKLRTMNNLYIMNLAIADFLIGLVSMNFFTIYLVYGEWIFGPIVCDSK